MFLRAGPEVRRVGKPFKFDVIGLRVEQGEEIVVGEDADDSILKLNVTISGVFEDRHYLLPYLWNQRVYPLAFDHSYLYRHDGVVFRLESALLKLAFRIVHDHSLAMKFLTLGEAVSKMTEILQLNDEDYCLAVAVLTFSILYAMDLIGFEDMMVTLDPDVRGIEHTLERRRTGTLILPKHWCYNNLFMWSVYAKEIPLYEVITTEDGFYHHPYIAVTDIRFRRLEHERCRVSDSKIYFPNLNMILEDPLLISILNAYASALKNGPVTYNDIEEIWVKRYGVERNACSWLTSVLIGLGVLKIV